MSNGKERLDVKSVGDGKERMRKEQGDKVRLEERYEATARADAPI